MKKELRKQVYNKYNGHCAYCGKVITYDEMQVDHLIPQRFIDKFGKDEIECFDNYMPSCRRCNHYKRGNSLQGFRNMIQTIPQKLSNNYICKVGIDYDLINLNYEKEVDFYFEKLKYNN